MNWENEHVVKFEMNSNMNYSMSMGYEKVNSTYLTMYNIIFFEDLKPNDKANLGLNNKATIKIDFNRFFEYCSVVI